MTSIQVAPSTTFPHNLPPGWRARLEAEVDTQYFKALVNFLKAEHRSGRTVFPARQHTMRALQSLDYDDVRLVILGQDPYHGPGQAIGLSFAVPNELQPKPPSLANIFQEISRDLGVDMAGAASDLSGWVEQGVLLLNTVLTVRAGQAMSHRGMGWETLTDRIIEELNSRPEPVIFLLWGAAAQKKKLLLSARHFVLESPHPSPLSASRGFFGCRHFSKANQILEQLGRPPIRWQQTGGTIS
jgi:uracil-DNA glycosylase